LTDVDGVYDRPPTEKGSKVIPFYSVNSSVCIGSKSNQGRGGMQAKINAAVDAVKPGSKCNACVIGSGVDLNCIRATLGEKFDPKFGSPKGTLFATTNSYIEKEAMKEVESSSVFDASDEIKQKATCARNEARKLQSLSYEEKQKMLYAIANSLVAQKEKLLAMNAIDIEQADLDDISLVLKKRLLLTEEKIQTLAGGIRQIADQANPLGVIKSKRELSDGLELTQVTVPIGVLLVIFESRPDCLPQISALALASGNGLLLKGGKEALNSLEALHEVIGDAIENSTNGKISRDIICLVTSRSQVTELLVLDDVIDLVIPRGSNELVSYIKQHTKIPVLGHSDGVCHVYVDASANIEDAEKIVIDSKTDYPSACNAMETLLLHVNLLQSGGAFRLLTALRAAGVKCLGGPNAMKAGLCDYPAQKFKCEYGDLTCTIEIVDSMDHAIQWIHNHGSSHTEVIVCEKDSQIGEDFLEKVDAACVFMNASSRFSDGYRFGLGAEVGISTGRIHARGPVGVEGLLTTKWQLRSHKGIDYVAEFGGASPSKVYTHLNLM